MNFILFQLVFVIILIALAIAAWLFIRAWRQRSAERAPTLERVAPAPAAEQAPKRGLGRKVAGNAKTEPEPPRVRRRQIGPASAVDTPAEDYSDNRAEDPADLSPEKSAPDVPEDFTPEEFVPEAMAAEVADIDAGEAFAEPAEAAPAGAIQTATMARLEDAFARLQRGDMTLDEYIALIDREDRSLATRIAELESDPAGHAETLGDARAALGAVDWCRQWAGEMVDDKSDDAI